MFLIPAFQIGWWNAWILMLIFPMNPLLLIVIDRLVGSGDIFKKIGGAPSSKTEGQVNVVYMSILYALFVYSIFLPLKLGTVWFYTGIAFYLVGLGLLLAAVAIVAMTPYGQIFTRGVYRFSRHPSYFSFVVLFLGVGITSASWIFLLFSVVNLFLLNYQASCEERGCQDTFGDAYKAYLDRTPRWIVIPKQN